MIALGTNLPGCAHRKNSEFHSDAMKHLRSVIEGGAPRALLRPAVCEFIGVLTHGHVHKPASPLSHVLAFLESLMASPQLYPLSESSGCFEKPREMAPAAKLTGPFIRDARIAALCLRHGVRKLWTANRGFSLFPKLKTRNPLVKK